MRTTKRAEQLMWTIRDMDRIEEFDKIRKLSKRQKRWLWHWLPSRSRAIFHGGARAPEENLDAGLEELFTRIDYPRRLLADALEEMDKRLTPSETTQWIDAQDYRLLVYIANEIGRSDLISECFSGEWHRELILAIDLLPEGASDKVARLRELRKKWLQIRTPDEQTKWLSLNNDRQLSWARHYVVQKLGHPPFLQPVLIHLPRLAVLAILDTHPFHHPLERKAFIDKMRKSWSQKKYRDSAGTRKQRYMPMQQHVHDRLTKMARAKGLKRYELAEQLIEAAYDEWSGKL